MLFNKKNKVNPKKANVLPPRELELAERAFRDWVFLLAGFALLVVSVVVVAGFLFVKVNRGDFFTAEPDATISTTSSNRKTLIDVNDFFLNRQKGYESFLTGTTTEIDPSL